VIFARREIKNSRTSARLSTTSTLRRMQRRLGRPVGTRLDRDSHERYEDEPGASPGLTCPYPSQDAVGHRIRFGFG
jgi:hypothetical protein